MESQSFSRSSRSMTTRIVAFALILGLLGLTSACGPSPEAQATIMAAGAATGVAQTQATSTAQAHATATAEAQAQATANAQGTATAEVEQTATAQAKATATAQAQATATAQTAATAQAQATATAEAQATATAEAQATATAAAQATATARARPTNTPQPTATPTTPASSQPSQPAATTDVTNVQISEVSPSELAVSVTYSYDGSQGERVYIGIEATGEIPGQVTPWGYAQIGPGSGTVVIQVVCEQTNYYYCLGGSTDAIWVKMMARWWDVYFITKMYPYTKNWVPR